MYGKKSFAKIILGLLLILVSGVTSIGCISAPVPSTPPSSVVPAKPSPSLPPVTSTSLTSIQFLGQACFLITSNSGLKIITDPYTVTSTLSYSPVDESADIVTVSHEHGDHNNVAAVKGQPEVLKGAGVKTIKGIELKGVATWHDAVNGAQRGPNTVFVFSMDGTKFCHLGDLGHRLSPEQISQIGKVDILLIPVGGNYTIDASTATEVCSDLKTKIIIPMHYKTVKANLPISGVEDFLQGKDNVKRLNGSIYQFKPGDLPPSTEILLLDPAR